MVWRFFQQFVVCCVSDSRDSTHLCSVGWVGCWQVEGSCRSETGDLVETRDWCSSSSCDTPRPGGSCRPCDSSRHTLLTGEIGVRDRRRRKVKGQQRGGVGGEQESVFQQLNLQPQKYWHLHTQGESDCSPITTLSTRNSLGAEVWRARQQHTEDCLRV